MRIINTANYVEGGKAYYIVSISLNESITQDDQVNMDGTEIIFCNGKAYPNAGGVGIPSVQDVYFYTIYDT